MKLATIAIAVLTLSNHVARADEYTGIGSANCKQINEFLEDKGSSKLMGSFVEQWVTGFFSGINLAVPDEQMRDITEDAVGKVQPELKAFCKSHPTENPFSVAGKAWKALPAAKK